MKAIPISEATEVQLRAFALDTLGITIKANAKPETVRAKVEAAWNKPDILVDDTGPDESEQPGSQAKPQPVTAEQQEPSTGMVRLTIGVTEEAGGNSPVELGCNGKVMLVPRGKAVEIPERFFESLAHAVMDKYDALPEGGMNPVPRKVPLYPFQVLVPTEFTDRLLRAAA